MEVSCDALVYLYLLQRDTELAARFYEMANPTPLHDGLPTLPDVVQFYQDQRKTYPKRKSNSSSSSSSSRSSRCNKRKKVDTGDERAAKNANCIDSLDEISADEESSDDTLLKEINKLNEVGPNSGSAWIKSDKSGCDADKSGSIEEPLNSDDEISVSDASSDLESFPL